MDIDGGEVARPAMISSRSSFGRDSNGESWEGIIGEGEKRDHITKSVHASASRMNVYLAVHSSHGDYY